MKLLVFAHIPSSHDGRSNMTKVLLDGLGGDARAGANATVFGGSTGIDCYHVDCGSEGGLEDGEGEGAGWGRIWNDLRRCMEAIWCRFRYGVRAFYYVPTRGRRGGIYRDWMVMLLCRPFFQHTVHHWEKVGLGDWLEAEGSALERWMTHWLLGKPALGIAPSVTGMRDPLWFESKAAEVVPPGMVDPCPDYAARIAPERARRVAARRALLTGASRGGAFAPGDVEAGGTVCVWVTGNDRGGLESVIEGLTRVLDIASVRGVSLRCRVRFPAADFTTDATERMQAAATRGMVFEPVATQPWSRAEERAEMWRECDCLVVAAKGDDAAGVALEAMAFGVPVVVDGRAAAADLLPADYGGKLWGLRPGEFAEAVLEAWTETGMILREEFLARHAPGPCAEQFRTALRRYIEAPGRVALQTPPGPRLEAPTEERTVTVLQIFNRYLEIGGEEKSVERIAQDMAVGGNKVVRFLRESSEWHAPSAPPKWKHPFLLWRNPGMLEELRALHQATQADCWVVHNFLPVISLDLYHEAGRLGVPVIQFLHNYRPLSPSGALFAWGHRLQPDDRWIAWKEALSGSWRGSQLLTAWLALGYWWIKVRGDFRHVRAWVAISDEMRQVFLRAGWPKEKTFALRHAWHPNPEGVSPVADEGFFLFIGRVVESKGVRFLIELWRAPELAHLQLVMAGEGDLAAELSAISPPNVRWIGFVDGKEKRHWLASCRAVLFPSLWDEPLGLVAYEAYEHHRPILASSMGGVKETVVDQVTGRLLPAGDHAAWLEAVRSLDVETAAQFGAEGHRWLMEHTAPEVWARQFNEILATVLARNTDTTAQ